ncbi:MAG TPA: TIM barrel protein, partial [Limnochordia bacterium]|nr:TIM barrel protein [Limnochordia bacterium]
ADQARREAGIAKLERLIDVTPEFGTPYLATETGSLNPESPWSDYAANHTQAAWNELLRILRRLAKRARAAGTVLLIEGYVNNVVATTAQAEKVLHELGADVVGFVLDPFNYQTRADLQTPAESMARIVRTLAPHAKIAHAKDVRYGANGVETPKVGDGRADWRAYAKALAEHAPQLPLVLEHLRPDEIPGCVAKVKAAFS